MITHACGLVAGSAAGAIAGFLMRPCCVGPLALSLLGVSSVGLADALVAHRLGLIATGGLALIATLVVSMRREGGWINKGLAPRRR